MTQLELMRARPQPLYDTVVLLPGQKQVFFHPGAAKIGEEYQTGATSSAKKTEAQCGPTLQCGDRFYALRLALLVPGGLDRLISACGFFPGKNFAQEAAMVGRRSYFDLRRHGCTWLQSVISDALVSDAAGRNDGADLSVLGEPLMIQLGDHTEVIVGFDFSEPLKDPVVIRCVLHGFLIKEPRG